MLFYPPPSSIRKNKEAIQVHSFELEEFARTAKRIRERAMAENRLLHNPPIEVLRQVVERQPGVKKTKYGNYVAESEPTSRSAMFTKNSVDSVYGDEERRLLAQCEEALSREKLISIDRVVGDVNGNTTVRLIVPERFAHVAAGGKNLFIRPSGVVEEPNYQIIFFADDAFEANINKPLPEKDITIRLAMLDGGRFVKVVRNGNYIGEFKKGVFAAEDWAAKTQRGGIFLHAGCREDILQSVRGDYCTKRSLLIALSANGKTSTTCRILARKNKEKSWLVQDDGGTLMPDGSFHGFEAGGVFVKTEGVNPGEQIEIYYALLKRQTTLENLYVDEDGDFDFDNVDRTSNGRAVVLRKCIMHACPHISVEGVDNLIIITRGPIIPAISRLTREQAAALMVLGQAMESSAGDPTQAGKIRSEFFYDPFVAGNLAEHANRFYEITQGIPEMNYYLLNTGGIGEGNRYRDIKLDFTMSVLDALLRGELEDWVESPAGFEVPKAIGFADDVYLHPEKLYSVSEFEEKNEALNRIRHEAVEKLGDRLHSDIRSVF